MTYVRKTIKCGPVCYIEEHPAPALGKNRKRPAPQNPTSESQAKLNDKYAARKLALKILCNFTPYKDLFVTLTPEQDVTEAEARKKIKGFLDGMRAYWKKRGKRFKYIVITEKQGQWHHHLIMQDTPLEVIRQHWEGEKGRVTISPLNPYDDYKNLSEYLIAPEKPSRKNHAENGKEPRQKGRRRYSCSKGLKEPEIEVKEIKRLGKSAPRAPKGYVLKQWALWTDEYGELHRTCRCVWAGPGNPPEKKRKKGKSVA